MPVHAVAAGAGGEKSFRGETSVPDGRSRITKAGEGFQRLLADTKQGHAATLLGVFEMANPGLSQANGFIFVGIEVTKLMILESKDFSRHILEL